MLLLWPLWKGNMISQAHSQQLQLKYGLPESLVKSLEESGEVCSLSPSEVRDHLGRTDIDSSGFLIKYPGNRATTIRLDTPHVNRDGKPQKYLHRKGELNYLYNPGVDLTQAGELWVVEGELKALCGRAQGLPIVGLSGVYNWRTSGEEAALLAEGEKLSDEEALLPELAQVNWERKKINLLYDSDITPGHKSYNAFLRLAEQLYRLGAEEVRILSLPSVAQGQKTGLDEFILARGPEALQDLQAIKSRKESYLPTRSGATWYAERKIKSHDLEDKQKAAIAYLGAKGKFIAGAWLKEQGLLQKDITPLLQEAKEKLAQLQAKPRTSSSSQAGEDLPELGPEYDTPKALLKITGEYSLDTQGRLCKEESKFNEKTGELNLFQIPLCNFVAWPIREILKDSGNGTPERYLELRGLLQNGEALPTRKVPLTDLLGKPTSWAGLTWRAGAGIKPYQEREVLYCIQRLAEAVPQTVVYSHLGWRKINGEWSYLHAGGAVGATEDVETDLLEGLGRYRLPETVENMKEAIQTSLSLLELAPKKITVPLLGNTYLAPLCSPLKQAGVEPSHMTYVLGFTGTWKSSLAALFLSHYGDFNKNNLPASFEDTKGGYEILASLAKDCILEIDDYHPPKTMQEKSRMEGHLEFLSRNQGDRHGKNRMTASSTSLREGHPPAGLVLITGEVCPLSGSSLARNLVIKLLAGDINKEKYDLALSQKPLLSQAMVGYLTWLRPQLDDVAKHDAEGFRKLRDKAAKTAKVENRHGRLNETVAHIYMGLSSFVQFALSQDALSHEEAQKILLEAWGTLNQIADEQTFEAEAGEPVKRFFEIVRILETTGRVYFADMEDTPTLLDHCIKIGWRDTEAKITYLLYEEAWRQVSSYLQSLEESLPCSKNGFPELVEIKKLLAKRGKKKRVYQERVGDKGKLRPYMLAVWDKAFEQEEENE
jgi:Domain of unknown function (DUF3854)